MLSEQLTTQYQDIYFKHFGIKISKEQALDEGLKLVGLIEVLNKHNNK